MQVISCEIYSVQEIGNHPRISGVLRENIDVRRISRYLRRECVWGGRERVGEVGVGVVVGEGL